MFPTLPRDAYHDLYQLFADLASITSGLDELKPPPSSIIFYDEIWGSVEIPWPVSAVFVAPIFTRTGGVKQLGSTSFMRTGATHTRLAHQIGVAHIMRNAYKGLVRNEHFSEKAREAFYNVFEHQWRRLAMSVCGFSKNNDKDPINSIINKILSNLYTSILVDLGEMIVTTAGLLHDIGHGGWSHALDGINELMRRRVEKAIKRASASTLLGKVHIHDIKKLDITVGTFLIVNNEQFKATLWPAFVDYIMDKINYESVKKFFKLVGEEALAYTTAVIISEDRGHLHVNGSYRQYMELLLSTFFRTLRTKDCTDILYVIAVAEFLAMIVEIGIFLLDGVNADRLDWVPRDYLNLNVGIEPMKQENNKDYNYNKCKGYNDLIEKINNFLENPFEYITINITKNGIFLNLSEKGNELEKHIKFCRSRLYRLYHDPRKSLVDSIVLRHAYAVSTLLEEAARKELSSNVADELFFALILSPDELFLDRSARILGTFGRWILLTLLDAKDTFSSHLAYAARTSTYTFTLLRRLFHHIAASGEHNQLCGNAKILVREKKQGAFLSFLTYIPISLNELGIYSHRFKKISEEKRREMIEILTSLRQAVIDGFKLPELEQELNNKFEELLNRKSPDNLIRGYVYLTAIHYPLRALQECLEDIELCQGNYDEILNRPLIFLIIHLTAPIFDNKQKDSQKELEQFICRNIIDQLDQLTTRKLREYVSGLLNISLGM